MDERINLLRTLTLFAKVEECETLTAAADAAKVTQAAISYQIRTLERYYDTALVRRDKRGGVRTPVELTPTGQLVADAGQRILQELARLRQNIADLDGMVTGRLLIGCSYTVGDQFVPRYLGEFHGEYPGVELEVRVGSTETITRQVLDGELDLGFVDFNPHRDGLAVAEVFPDKLVAFVPPDHPLQSKAFVPPSSLMRQQFVLREPGSATRRCADECLHAVGCKPKRVIELGTSEAVKGAVQAGLGIGILSEGALTIDFEAGILAKLELEGWECMQVHYLIHPDRTLTRSEKAFLSRIPRVHRGNAAG